MIITSDHGMATVPPGNVVAIEDMVDREGCGGRDDAGSPSASIRFQAASAKRKRGSSAGTTGMTAGGRASSPKRWRYGSNPRVPAIVCQMHEGWDAAPRASLAKRPSGVTRGSHGFDPALPSMRAVFIAADRRCAAGSSCPRSTTSMSIRC